MNVRQLFACSKMLCVSVFVFVSGSSMCESGRTT